LENELHLVRQDRARFQEEAGIERNASLALKQEVYGLRMALSGAETDLETHKLMIVQMTDIQAENRRLRDIEIELRGL
jgi:hypothetical protein